MTGPLTMRHAVLPTLWGTWLIIWIRKLTIEEQFMAEQFADDHARYRSEVSALIPFVV
ncbi:MAG: hypothetical protein ACREB8_09665 [Pseudolabrys sp.]